MPSDFDPQLLVLGDKSDVATFANVLAQFAIHPEAITLNDSGVFSEDTTVSLQAFAAGGDMGLGLWRDKAAKAHLVWSLTPDHASKFSKDLRKISSGDKMSGSAVLEVEALNEIRVHVSVGEFEADFLTGDAR
ncbi:MAG: hypothetical protein KUG69_09325 [Marinosulfonomonas sp.]|nr:hypothetical protein [Marinosulfonomonas sp.]